MLRLALTPRWVGWFALTAALCVAFVLLGQWQWGRYETRAARADRVEAHYDAEPVAATSVMDAEPLPVQEEWRRVVARGRYEPAQTVLARNRPHDGEYGYEVLVPLRLDDGQILVVDRGWVPNADEGAAVRPDVPGPPDGEVEVVGWARLSEPSLGRDMPADQVASIHLPEVAARVGGPVLGGYLDLEQERGEGVAAAPDRPQPLEEPDTGTGPHLAYALQWWLGVPVALVYALVALRREARTAAGLPARASHPRKVRIWDEEDG